MKHYLKIHPQHYHRVKEGIKTFEIRDNDRAFQMGDYVDLCWYDPETSQYSYRNPSTDVMTHNDLSFEIGCVYSIEGNKVVFSLLPIDTL